METGPLKRYRRMIELGELELDPAQLLAAEKLQLLANRLAQYEPPERTDFFSYFTRERGEVPEGLYMFGGVGRGKTMLMDLFFETVPFAAKARVHFHEFMADIHERIAAARKGHDGDPIAHVAAALAQQAQLLCFDELHVTDIADAMILGRLFQGLFDGHVVMVATSNAAPWELLHPWPQQAAVRTLYRAGRAAHGGAGTGSGKGLPAGKIAGPGALFHARG
jgi:cell division protein ZapE